MSDKRDPAYFEVTETVVLKLNLDPDLYNAATLTKVGGTRTAPADTVKVIPINIKYAVGSGFLKIFKATVTRGEGNAQKTRNVDLLVHTSKSAAIITAAGKPDTLRLGQGANPVAWDVVKVV